MPKYDIIYEIVESYDASIDADSLDDLTAAVEQAHWNDEIDRSYRDGSVRVVEIWMVDDEG